MKSQRQKTGIGYIRPQHYANYLDQHFMVLCSSHMLSFVTVSNPTFLWGIITCFHKQLEWAQRRWLAHQTSTSLESLVSRFLHSFLPKAVTMWTAEMEPTPSTMQ